MPELVWILCHSMDGTVQISTQEEPAEDQDTEKKIEYLDVCLNLYGFYTLARIAGVN